MKKYLFACTMFLVFSACREEIVHVSSELEANKVMLGLRLEGIDAKKTYLSKEWIIDVPKSSLTEALKILDEKRVFRNDPGDEVTQSGSELFSSRQEKEARANKIIAANLSSTLRILPGVLDARVHIFQYASEAFSLGNNNTRSASVLLVLKGEAHVSLEQVKELVSQGGGLKSDAVSVIIVESQVEKAESNVESSITAVDTEPVIKERMEQPTYVQTMLARFHLTGENGIKSIWIVLAVLLFSTGCIAFVRRKRKRRPEPLDPEEFSSLLDEEIEE
jgi:type III secretory pathway lipoprotein EscJ